MTQPDLKFEIVDESAPLELVKAEPQPIFVSSAEKEQIETRVVNVVSVVKALEIKTPEQNALMVEHLKGVKALKAEAEATWRPRIKQADDLHAGLLSDLRKYTDPLNEAESIGKRRCIAWDQEQERLRQEEIRRQQAEYERQLREAREAQEKAEADARRIREEMERQEAERLEAELERAEAAGATAEEVQAIIEQPRLEPAPVFIPQPVIVPQFAPPPPVAPKPQGSVMNRPWKASVDTPSDLMRLIQHVAQHPEYSNLLQLNQTALNALAKAQGANLRIPGVRAFQDATMSIRK